MKEAELRGHAKCSLCGKKIGESALPLFSVVTVQRYGLHLDAVKRQTGLAYVFNGNAAIAFVMGPDEDMAELLSETRKTVCENCFIGHEVLVAQLAESES